MPMHDWTRVRAGTYHHFHYFWLVALMDRLNAGLLPPGYFVMAKRRSGPREAAGARLRGGAVTTAPPQTAIVERTESRYYAHKSNRLAIHHGLGNIVAVVELVSPGHKDTKHALRSFARKSAALLRKGVHLSVIDPFPPGRYDPHGIHRSIWDNVTLSSTFEQPSDLRLTLVSYEAGQVPTAYIEPFAVGQALPDLPLFLDEGIHVKVPLEETYLATWNVLPVELRRLVDSHAP